MTIRLRRATCIAFATPLIAVVAAAYVEWLVAGLPALAPIGQTAGGVPAAAGFPAWLRLTHYVNLLLLVLLIRSGLQILMDHPRLYWSVHSTPGTDWIRFTPVHVPPNRYYTSQDDARALTPWVGIPGGRHTIGLARYWHFAPALFWVANGVIYVVLLGASSHWRRIVPMSWACLPQAWSVFVHYVTFHLPSEPDGFYAYNALQQLSYFGIVFIVAPVSILTGPSMSPALVNWLSWYRRMPGNRQVGRSLHFLMLCAYVAFVVVHVAMVVLTGFARNMNHIVMGADTADMKGVLVGAAGLGIVVLVNVFANVVSRRAPRRVQQVGESLIAPVTNRLLSGRIAHAQYMPEQASPYLWANGKLPAGERWSALVRSRFREYRLDVGGLVEHPMTLSLTDLERMPRQRQITLHNCIQGWSGIAEWGGITMGELMARVVPKPNARAVIIYSFGRGVDDGAYYETHTIETMRHPLTLLAYEMNYRPLGVAHGAPLRLRVEEQLGFKMVKWIKAIEFVEDYRHIRGGYGGTHEDNEFFDSMADI